MQAGKAYDKGIRKNQLTGSYGNFSPALIKSDGGRYPTDVVYFKTAESEGQVWHPTQKPVSLGQYLVRTYTLPSDVVLDNCFGSGSFLVSAAQEGRDSIGIEKNADKKAFKNKGNFDLMELAYSRLEQIAKTEIVREFNQVAQSIEKFTKSRRNSRSRCASNEQRDQQTGLLAIQG